MMAQEHSAGRPTPSSDSWWGTGWLWGEDETIDFAELTAAENLGWRESYVHFLALCMHRYIFIRYILGLPPSQLVTTTSWR